MVYACRLKGERLRNDLSTQQASNSQDSKVDEEGAEAKAKRSQDLDGASSKSSHSKVKGSSDTPEQLGGVSKKESLIAVEELSKTPTGVNPDNGFPILVEVSSKITEVQRKRGWPKGAKNKKWSNVKMVDNAPVPR